MLRLVHITGQEGGTGYGCTTSSGGGGGCEHSGHAITQGYPGVPGTCGGNGGNNTGGGGGAGWNSVGGNGGSGIVVIAIPKS